MLNGGWYTGENAYKKGLVDEVTTFEDMVELKWPRHRLLETRVNKEDDFDFDHAGEYFTRYTALMKSFEIASTGETSAEKLDAMRDIANEFTSFFGDRDLFASLGYENPMDMLSDFNQMATDAMIKETIQCQAISSL